MKITPEGQVTIPAEIRDKLGLLPNTEVEFELIGDVVYLKKANSNLTAGEKLVEMMRVQKAEGRRQRAEGNPPLKKWD